MSQNTSVAITVDQLRNRDIVATDLLSTVDADRARFASIQPGARDTVISAPITPLSVFGRKIVGHDS